MPVRWWKLMRLTLKPHFLFWHPCTYTDFFFENCVFQSWKKSVCCICFKYSFLLWITLWTQHWKEKYLTLQSSREYFHIKFMLYHCYFCLKSSAQYRGGKKVSLFLCYQSCYPMDRSHKPLRFINQNAAGRAAMNSPKSFNNENKVYRKRIIEGILK